MSGISQLQTAVYHRRKLRLRLLLLLPYFCSIIEHNCLRRIFPSHQSSHCIISNPSVIYWGGDPSSYLYLHFSGIVFLAQAYQNSGLAASEHIRPAPPPDLVFHVKMGRIQIYCILYQIHGCYKRLETVRNWKWVNVWRKKRWKQWMRINTKKESEKKFAWVGTETWKVHGV